MNSLKDRDSRTKIKKRGRGRNRVKATKTGSTQMMIRNGVTTRLLEHMESEHLDSYADGIEHLLKIFALSGPRKEFETKQGEIEYLVSKHFDNLLITAYHTLYVITLDSMGIKDKDVLQHHLQRVTLVLKTLWQEQQVIIGNLNAPEKTIEIIDNVTQQSDPAAEIEEEKTAELRIPKDEKKIDDQAVIS